MQLFLLCHVNMPSKVVLNNILLICIIIIMHAYVLRDYIIYSIYVCVCVCVSTKLN